MAYRLDTPIAKLEPRAGPKLAKHRNVHTIGDLLDFLPRRYLPRHPDLGRLREGVQVVLVATVRSASARPMRARRGRLLEVTITDGSHELQLTFFRSYGHEDRLVPGARGLFAGEVSRYRGQWQLAHPAYELFPADDPDDLEDPDDPGDADGSADAEDGRGREDARAAREPLLPVYLPVAQVQSWTIGRAVRLALDVLEPFPDPLPPKVRDRRRLPEIRRAYEMAHHPRSAAQWREAYRRFRYEEALTVQLVLAQRRLAGEQHAATPRRPVAGGLRDAFDARLPFTLTSGQRAVAADLDGDLARDRPMHRLLQGEVGSGKTVVALRAMLQVIDAGGQAALLAPTEVLAAQHHRTVVTMLGELAQGGMLGGADNGTQVVLLTGSQGAAERRAALDRAASGEAGIVVGTHALIQDAVKFRDLGLVVVDEQHRFGVHQRDALRGKGALPPHVLVMTATPIPRTVAMTVFGDMEVSTLAELPAGRSPIATHVVVDPRWLERAWQRVAEEVAAGHQAYVVCPRIGDEAEPGADEVGPTGAGTDPDAETEHPEDPEDPEDYGDDREIGDRELPERAVHADVPGAGGPAEPGPGSQEPGSRGPGSQEPGRQGPGPGDAAAAARDAVGEPGDLRSVLATAEHLRAHSALAGVRIGVLHGRQAPEAKESVMADFTSGRVDVLVSTTVVEVGVDVPNATVMVVLDADRFGVSQLHQLRGRVGRGDAPGLCLLVSGAESPAAVRRLTAVAATTDGFDLARLDLEHRREGDVLGSRQSGTGSQLRLLRLLRDEELIVAAREDAHLLVSEDPGLAAHPVLRGRVEALGEDQAAYLERG